MSGAECAGPPMSLASATRTLLVAGFAIVRAQRQPTHAEVQCTRVDTLGSTISYLIAICDRELQPDELDDVKNAANSLCLVPVIVTAVNTPRSIGWNSFLEALGGEVPTWRALTPDFADALRMTSRNIRWGRTGEAWLQFEDLVADGLEFALGRRVRRLGGRMRGRRVSDMIAQLPNGSLLVADAKAARSDFDVRWDELRALVEYTKRQIERQQGHIPVTGAVLLSSEFRQSAKILGERSSDFLAETGVPLTFGRSEDIVVMCERMAERPDLRNAINWRRLFVGGLFSTSKLVDEIQTADNERVSRGR